MADINKKTEILRTDPDFKKFVLELSRFKSSQEKTEVKSSRITQAMYKQYLKYPELLNEIKLNKLGKWKPK